MQTKTTTLTTDIKILEDTYDLFNKDPPLKINFYKQIENNQNLYNCEIISLSKYLEIDTPKHIIIDNKKYLQFFCVPKIDINSLQQKYWSVNLLLEMPKDLIEIFTVTKVNEYKTNLFLFAVEIDIYKQF